MQEYKLRAECPRDIGEMLREVDVETMVYKFDKQWCDVEITFTSPWSLERIRQALRRIDDGHVMVETVQLAADYTGERVE